MQYTKESGRNHRNITNSRHRLDPSTVYYHTTKLGATGLHEEKFYLVLSQQN